MISIIIPVYNAERYLMECLDSILHQSYQDYEIILVDDGSIDHSLTICNSYAGENPKIRVIHQENGGSTKARKTGLKVAQGEYISFVDSDDWIDPCCLEKLYGLAEKNQADIVTSGCMAEQSGRSWSHHNKLTEGYYSGKELREKIYPQMLYFDDNGYFAFGILQYLCGKLFKKSIIEQCIYNLDERIYDGEDVACVYDACLKASSIVIDNHSYYHYRIHENSVCTSVRDERYFANAVYLYRYMSEVFQKAEEREIMIPQLKYFISHFINNGMRSAFGCGFERSYAASVWRLPEIPTSQNCKLALCGAGTMGFSYYKQLLDYKNVEMDLWVDSAVYGKRIGGVCIESPEVLKDTGLDYVIIAVRSVSDREEIIKKLEGMGIAKEKILYRDAERYCELYEFCI